MDRIPESCTPWRPLSCWDLSLSLLAAKFVPNLSWNIKKKHNILEASFSFENILPIPPIFFPALRSLLIFFCLIFFVSAQAVELKGSEDVSFLEVTKRKNLPWYSFFSPVSLSQHQFFSFVTNGFFLLFLQTEPSQPAQPFTPFHPFGFGFGFGFPGYGFGFPGYGYGFPGYGFGGYNPYMMAGAYYMDPFLFNAFFTPNGERQSLRFVQLANKNILVGIFILFYSDVG